MWGSGVCLGAAVRVGSGLVVSPRDTTLLDERVVFSKAGRAALETANTAQVEMIDQIDVGSLCLATRSPGVSG